MGEGDCDLRQRSRRGHGIKIEIRPAFLSVVGMESGGRHPLPAAQNFETGESRCQSSSGCRPKMINVEKEKGSEQIQTQDLGTTPAA